MTQMRQCCLYISYYHDTVCMVIMDFLINMSRLIAFKNKFMNDSNKYVHTMYINVMIIKVKTNIDFGHKNEQNERQGAVL